MTRLSWLVLVACTPFVGWSFCWALRVLPVDRLFVVGFARGTNESRRSLPTLHYACLFARVVTPCFWVPDPQDLSATDCVCINFLISLENRGHKISVPVTLQVGVGSRCRLTLAIVRAVTATKHEPGPSPLYRVVSYGSAMVV